MYSLLCVFFSVLCFTTASLFVLELVILCLVYFLCCCLFVSTSAIDCLERLVSEVTCYVSSGTVIRSILSEWVKLK